MIVVIADDLAGAAEMGGIALRHGLTAEVQLEHDTGADVDLIVVDTDTRSCTAEEAAQRMESIAELCRDYAIKRVFKKVDSVLRGHVVVELTALLEAWDKRRALLVPANPALGRTVTRGRYWIHGQPLHETDFADDPEYPATTSDVRQVLFTRAPLGARERWPIYILQPGKTMPERGIVVGEAMSEADLGTWANSLDSDTVPVGAAEFFGAFLRAMGHELLEGLSVEAGLNRRASVLFVCGSTSSHSRSFCQRCEASGIPVLRMPTGLFDVRTTSGADLQSSRWIREWADATVRSLERCRWVVVAVDRPLRQDPGLPQVLSGHLGVLVERITSRYSVDHLFVTGGATAASLVQRMGWKRLRVRRELAPGVVQMQIEGRSRPLLTMKPGSYTWPEEVRRHTGGP